MNSILVVVIIIAIAMAVTGGLVKTLGFLLWVGLILAAISVIAWLLRMGKNGTRTRV